MGLKNKNIEDFYPLSPMQQGILFHSLAAPKSGVYVEQFSFTLRGDLDVAAFNQAWRQIIERHSILRTSFAWEGLKEPVQVVHRQVKLPFAQQDWRTLSSDEQPVQLENFLQAERTQGFELTHPPLMRLTLIQLSDTCYNLTWSHHHLLLDGWSVAAIFKEVLTCYKAFSNGEEVYLEPTRPYRDYIVWLQQQNLSEAETFWRRMLKGFTAPTQLLMSQGSTGRLSDLEDCYDEKGLKLSSATTAALRALAQQNHLTLNTLVQGAWALLLSRYSGEQDVVFGVTVSGRPATLDNAQSMVGLFINTLPLRVQVESGTFLLPWLKQIQAHQAEARQYEYSPLVNVQGWSEVSRGSPLFESILVFENYPVEASLQEQTTNLEIHKFCSFEKTNYPLTLVVAPGSELRFKLVYHSGDRFDAAVINRMLGHLEVLLESLIANLDQRLSELPILTEAERRQLLVEWNNTHTDYPQEQCIHQVFEEQVERSPDAIAAVFEDQQLTYRELNARANQLAQYLQSLGVRPEVLVGVCLDRSLEMLIGLLGILKAGGAYVPLDPAYPKQRLNFMLSDSQAPVLLTQRKLAPTLTDYRARLVCLDTDWGVVSQGSEDNPTSSVLASNLAYVIYTSGSTGKPKGVAIEHHSSVVLLNWAREVFLTEQLAFVLAATSICFDLSVFELFVPLSCGGKILLAKNILHLPTLPAATEVTLVNTVPSVMADLLKIDGLPHGVSTVNLAGESLHTQLVRQIFQQDAIEQVFNLYGPSEDTTYSTFASAKKGANKPTAPIGRPIANTQIYILDSHFQLVPIGVVGELYIGGAGLARGYLNCPDLTGEKFIPNPFGDESGLRLYKTGDLACYRSDGEIEYLGRIDDQVKIRGFRIELGEIEAVLNQHPAVQANAVVVREDEPGNKHLVAYVVFQSEQKSTTTELRRFLEEKLPRYMTPTTFMPLPALPLTPNGKLNRRALPMAEALRPELEVPYLMPRTEVERTIASIWRQALKVEKIGVHDNFFELGGHSLLMVRVHGQLREQFKTDLSMLDMFRYPTISALAEYVSQVQNQTSSGSRTDIQTEKLEAGKAQQRKRLQKMKAIGNM